MGDSCFLLPKLSRNGFVIIESILHLKALVLSCMLLLLLALLVKVVFTQANVSLYHHPEIN